MQFLKSNTATPFCKICFQRIKMNSLRYFLGDDPPICRKCFEQFEPQWIRWKVGNVRCLALYEYGGDIKSTLYKFKGCGDYELYPVFFYFAAPYIKARYHDFYIVPTPSSQSHNDARGFNQVVAMCRDLRLKMLNPLSKFAESKQSDLSAKERQKVGKIIGWIPKVNVRDKKILLVDDVYTTGSTIKACIGLLQKHGARKIEVLVMSKTFFRRA